MLRPCPSRLFLFIFLALVCYGYIYSLHIVAVINIELHPYEGTAVICSIWTLGFVASAIMELVHQDSLADQILG